MDDKFEFMLGEASADVFWSTVAKTFGDIIEYKKWYYHTLSSDQKNAYQEYKKYSIGSFLCLLKIERLFDLGYIDKAKKELLIDVYNNYKKLNFVTSSGVYYAVLNGTETAISEEEFHNMWAKKNEYGSLLDEYGILEDFNYYDAFINQTDCDIRKFTKKKNNSCNE